MPKILCLTGHDLDGQDHGAVLRARNLFKLLARLGEVKLVLAGFHEPWQAEPGGLCGGFELLRTIRFEVTREKSLHDRWHHEFNPRFMNTDWIQAGTEDRAWLRQTLPQYDLVWVHGLHLTNGLGIWRWPRGVLDIDDIPSSYHRSQLSLPVGLRKKLGLKRQIILWERHERTLWERFEAVCVCSEADRKMLARQDRTFVVPNGFNPPERLVPRQPATPAHIGFVGNFSYAPNREGVRWFVERVWPLILKKNPTARLRLAGSKSETEPWPAGCNIDALGWLPDVATEMASWSLSVVPVLTGGGTRIKIAESFGYRCPVVATSLGAYGYDVKDGEELFLADEPADFAAKCERLLADASLGERMANRAGEKFTANWTWEAQAGRVAAVVENVLARPRT